MPVVAAVIAGAQPPTAALADGQVVGWGSNEFGQTAFPSASALPFVQWIGGQLHTVGVLADGSVRCWGFASGAILSVPAGLSEVRMVAAADTYTLALRNDGTVVGWGDNQDGRCMGTDASGSPRRGPPDGLSVRILGQPLEGVVRLAAGGRGPVACTRQGSLAVWGSSQPPPQPLPAVTDCASGLSHVLVLRSDGAVQAWGGWSDGAFGEASVPASLSGVARVFAAPGPRSIALRADGTVVSWGSNEYGECLGTTASGAPITGTPDGRAVLVRGAPLTGVRDIAAGYFHTVALRSDGTVETWGENAGQRSLPTTLSGVQGIGAGWWTTYTRGVGQSLVGAACSGFESLVVAPSPSNRFVAIASGDGHTLAIRADRSIVAWGDNGNFQCSVPADIGDVLQVAGGSQHSIALLSSGRVRCWGSNTGPGGVMSNQGTDLSALSGVTQVACGSDHNLARRSTGSVVCWGYNESGRCLGSLSSGAPIESQPTGQATRVRGVTLASISQVAGGRAHSLAVNAAGVVTCWGSNLDQFGAVGGQCVPPSSLAGVRDVAGGSAHSLALRGDGTVVGWGSNYAGESLGTAADGAPILGQPAGQPVQIGGVALTGVKQVAATGSGGVALRNDGTVAAWGAMRGSVPAGLASATAIAAGSSHVVALLGDAASDCAGVGSAGIATLARSGGLWQDVQSWSWGDGGWRVPGSGSEVRIDTGSVSSGCQAEAGTLSLEAGSTLVVAAEASAPGNDHTVRCGTARLAGRLWLLGLASGARELPSDPAWRLPVLSAADAASITGTFDLLQSDVPPPAGHFLTLSRDTGADGRVTLSLRVLAMPVRGDLVGRDPATFSGAAVAADTIDIDGAGFDDLALLVSDGPTQPGLLQILLNDGTGRLRGDGGVLKTVPPLPTCIAVGDVDGDGLRDVVAGFASDRSVRVYRADGRGGLVPGLVIPDVRATPTSVIVIPPLGPAAMPAGSTIGVGTSDAKLRIYADGSLQQEVAVAGGVTTLRGGTQTTGGTRGRDIATGGTRSSSVTAIAAAETGFVQVVRVRASGPPEVGAAMPITAKPVALDMADIDGDGLDDIVTANADPVRAAAGSALPVLSIFRNVGGTYAGGVPFQPVDPATGLGALAGLDLSLVDADGDGDRDIVCVQRGVGSTSIATLLRVDTQGADTPISIGLTRDLGAEQPSLCARGNLDGDGLDDVYLVGSSEGTSLVGRSVAQGLVATGSARPADLDGSGVVDFGDVTLLMLEFGPCPGCPADLDGSGVVDFGDVVLVLLEFG